MKSESSIYQVYAYHYTYSPDSERQVALIVAAQKRLENVWAVLEQEYAQMKNQHSDQQSWLFTQRPTTVDVALATVLLLL